MHLRNKIFSRGRAHSQAHTFNVQLENIFIKAMLGDDKCCFNVVIDKMKSTHANILNTFRK